MVSSALGISQIETEVILGPGELEFVGNLEKSGFRNHLELFTRFVGYVHYARLKSRKAINTY